MTPLEVVKGHEDEPIAIKTRLGWTVIGNNENCKFLEQIVNDEHNRRSRATCEAVANRGRSSSELNNFLFKNWQLIRASNIAKSKSV